MLKGILVYHDSHSDTITFLPIQYDPFSLFFIFCRDILKIPKFSKADMLNSIKHGTLCVKNQKY